MTEEFYKLLLSFILFFIAFLFPMVEVLRYVFFILSYAISSSNIYIEAFHHLCHKEFFSEQIFMIVATIGIFISGRFAEAVVVILLFQLGKYLSYIIMVKTRCAITKSIDLRVPYVYLVDGGKTKKTAIKKVKVGDVFLVRPGEKIPLDGVVIEGESLLDTSKLTGEVVLKRVGVSSTVLSGVVNTQSVLKIRSTCVYATSTANKLIELVEHTDDRKTEMETFMYRFSKIYTLIVVSCCLLFLFISILLGYSWQVWFYRGLFFVAIVYPSAFVFSIPLSYFCGIGRASKEGVLIKSSSNLDQLRKITSILFDKTGTLTNGEFSVYKIVTSDIEEEEFLQYIRAAEDRSSHLIAKTIKKAFPLNTHLKVREYQEMNGKGITCIVHGKKIHIGSRKFMTELQIKTPIVSDLGTIIYVAIAEEYVGYLVLRDEIKDSSYQLNCFQKVGVSNLVMLSGDNKRIVGDTAKKVGITEYYAELLSTDKVDKILDYKGRGTVMFVGDGSRDASVLQVADLAVSMGNIESDAVIEAGDIILLRDDVTKLAQGILISKESRKLLIGSITAVYSVKLLLLLLAVFASVPIWVAVFVDGVSSVLSILNVIRIMWKKI